VLGERLAQEFAFGGVVRRLEAAQQLIKGVQHLFGQALTYLVLELAAAFKERGKALRTWQAQEPRLTEKQAQGSRDRPAGGFDHIRDVEINPTRAFTAGR
jgi:hypothetical protein